MKNIPFLPLILLILIIPLSVSSQELSLASMFTDAMVLQQKSSAPVWGKGMPGTTVTVSGSWGNSVSCLVNPDGTWKTELLTPEAGGPHTVTVTQDSRSITLNEVLIGEVWLCSGQSNMEMPLRGWPPSDTIGGWFNEIPNAFFPQIRMFTVERTVATEPRTECIGSWKECSPATAAAFSATAYFFGKKLHKELNVPIGLILSSWGGTPVQAWTSEPFIVKSSIYANAAEQFTQTRDGYRALQKWISERTAVDLTPFISRADWRGATFGDSAYERAGRFDSSWHVMDLPGGWERTDVGQFDGVVWYRRTITIPSAWKGKELSIELGPIDDFDAVYVNGVKAGGLETGNPWNIPRAYIIPAAAVNDSVLTIAVRVIDTGGGGGFWGNASQMNIGPREGSERRSIAGEWRFHAAAEIRNGKAYLFDRTKGLHNRPRVAVEFGPDHPASLYNGMIAPVIPYAIKGVIWYQGESNTVDPEGYAELFPLMIENWRSDWKKDLPFYFVQIAPFEYGPQVRSERLRESQLRSLSVPGTGMAVTLDIGDAVNIHPHNKKDVGDRLAKLALANDYGKKIEFSGPVFRSAAVKKNTMVLTFDHADGLTVRPSSGKNYFMIAGADSVFHPAEVLVKGKTLIVRSNKVKKPAAVRYAWGNVVTATLFNRAGLPASSFRTDRWK